MRLAQYWHCFIGIQIREWLRFWQQRTRFASALVRPLLWLAVFAAGFRAVLGVSIIPPYATYITYETYIAPGLCGMIILFNSMQGALSMVYDRELGSMRVLLMSPLPRPFLLVTKLLAMGVVSIGQVYVFLFIAFFFDVEPPALGYLAVFPALLLTALMLGALGLIIATWVKQLENFAGVMNFVIFPMFFLSSALYPLWKMQDASPVLYWICQINPFTHAVEAIRFALYLQWNSVAFGVLVGVTVVLALLATAGFRPQRTRIVGVKSVS
ncbi:multidrug ABC transporter permease [Marinobacter sp. R17]|uniref:ABC transporter permease n=1 Tax=Marinobacter sp. R17 TaxID=2484250 RepID=UPI000F4C6123|nr:ABC transporter permease [Marinobacter sp. R17]ROU00683.1 multidrug ABC transporter permease [Marinobacter sp. R17]